VIFPKGVPTCSLMLWGSGARFEQARLLTVISSLHAVDVRWRDLFVLPLELGFDL